MTDRGIAEIEKAAHSYVDARDERMRVGEEEQRRHTKLLGVMKKHGKKVYVHRSGDEIIDIRVTAKDPEEKAKVKIKPADEYKAPKEDTPEPDAVDTETDAADLDLGGGEGQHLDEGVE